MASNVELLEWSLGFRNRATSKYLTQETFNFNLNITGGSLKKKQTYFLLPADNGGVYIKSNLGRYLTGLADGKVTGDSDSPSVASTWTIEPQPTGTWALKSNAGFYAVAKGEDISAFTKELPKDRSGEWVVHLAMHPQVNLFSVMRKRYAAVRGDALCAVEDIPWGEDALLNFVFLGEHPDGRYGIQTFNGQYLTASGKLSPASNPPKEAYFLLGFHDNAISLRDEQGNYLTCIGANGTLKTNKNKVTKDELFQLSDSEPQFVIIDSKGKQVSIRSSVEVKADQVTVEDAERFQLEIDPSGSGKVAFKANSSNYFSTTADGTISASAQNKGPTEYFTVQYVGNRVKIIGSNGKFVTVKPNGGLIANGNGSESTAQFTLTLINRPELILRGQHGFVAVKGKSGRIEVNKSEPSTFLLKSVDGAYTLSYIDDNGTEGYWNVDRDGVGLTGSPALFLFEFVERSKFLIKHADTGKYLEGEQAGSLRPTGSGSNGNTLWEY